jgi:hypothetical protein
MLSTPTVKNTDITTILGSIIRCRMITIGCVTCPPIRLDPLISRNLCPVLIKIVHTHKLSATIGKLDTNVKTTATMNDLNIIRHVTLQNPTSLWEKFLKTCVAGN